MDKTYKLIGFVTLCFFSSLSFSFGASECATYATASDNVCQAVTDCALRKREHYQQLIGTNNRSPSSKINDYIILAGSYAYDEPTIYKALQYINKAYALLDDVKAKPEQLEALKKQVLLLRGAYALRLGELKNCINNHNADSCIVPLSENAQHADKYGSTLAIDNYQEYLDTYGRDEHIVWLLNLAYQTIGGYPDSVPKKYLLPEASFQSPINIGRFVDVAGPLGLQKQSLQSGGMAVDDFNGDGYLDVMITGMGFCDPILYFENNTQGGFTDKTAEAGFSQVISKIGIQPVDYNNDGLLDVFLSTGVWQNESNQKHLPPRYNRLYQNQGKATFKDVTKKVGLKTIPNSTLATAWGDYNNNGWLDVIVCNEFDQVELFANNKGVFEKQKTSLGDSSKRCKSAAWGDINNDGFIDLYLSYHGHKNFLYLNDQKGGFKAVTNSPVTKVKNSFVAFFFDYNNDGWEDLLVANFEFSDRIGGVEFAYEAQNLPIVTNTMRLFENTGGGEFKDVTKLRGLDKSLSTMGVNFGDINNNGYPDIYFGTGGPNFDMVEPNRLLVNMQGKKFADATFSAGVGNIQKGHGISFADINNDGSNDLLAQFGGATPGDKFFPSLYLNPGQKGTWVTLDLQGVKANRSAIGARLEISVKTPKGNKKYYKTIGHGGNFGTNPLRAHIGLGEAQAINSVSITWRGDLKPQVLKGLELEQRYVVVEGQPAKKRELKKLDLSSQHKTGGHRHH